MWREREGGDGNGANRAGVDRQRSCRFAAASRRGADAVRPELRCGTSSSAAIGFAVVIKERPWRSLITVSDRIHTRRS